MLSSGGGEDNDNLNKNHHHHRVSCRSSSLSSSSSTTTTSSNHSPFSPSSTLFSSSTTTTRTMEEVWKDINLSSLHSHRHSHRSSTANPTATTAYPGSIVQDFLGRPFSSNNDTPTSVSSPGYGSPSPPPGVVQLPPRPTLLNLNTGPDQLSFLEDDPTQNVPPLDVQFDDVLASANSSSLVNNLAGMRMLPATDRAGGDRRHKRMIKNRESAARSRARKQAYTNELENEVKRLKEENARLKKQQQQVQTTAAARTGKRRSGLHRTSTAPF